MSNLKDHEALAVSTFVHAFTTLTAQLGVAADDRYRPAPMTNAARGRGPDPTLDTITDPSRVALNEAIQVAISKLRVATLLLQEATAALEGGHAPYVDN